MEGGGWKGGWNWVQRGQGQEILGEDHEAAYNDEV